MSRSRRIRLLVGSSVRLSDPFATLDLGRYAVTDTQSKLAAGAGGLTFAAKAVPAWDDPRVTYIREAITPRAGLAFEQEMTFSALGGIGWGLDDSNPVVMDLVPGWYTTGSGVLMFVRAGPTEIVTPLTVVAGQSYRFLIILTNPGARWYYSTDGLTYYPLWVDAAGYTTPLYLGLSNNAAVGSSAWWRYFDARVPLTALAGAPTITPTLGAELVVNGNMETGSPPNNWTASNAVLTAQPDERTGGSGAQSIQIANTGANYGVASQSLASQSLGQWLQLTAWLKNGSTASNPKLWNATDAGVIASLWHNAAGWANVVSCGRVTTGGTPTLRLTNGTNGDGQTALYDDVSVKPITLASTLALVGDPGTYVGLVACHPTLTAGTQCGVWTGLDDETNPGAGLLLYHDGTGVSLLYYKAGAVNSVLLNAVAATYSAGAELSMVVIPGAGTNRLIAVYYNGAQVGTVQGIDLAALVTSKVAGFSTLAGNSPGTISVHVPIRRKAA